jgi:hypothetical protein
LPAKKRTGKFAVRDDPSARLSGDATDDSPAMPVEIELLPGLDLFRNVHTVCPSIGVLEAENAEHAAFIGVTPQSLTFAGGDACSSSALG